ncbi:uncharacterized protein LOC112093412 [Morus notabilis]|uniref:uncharacterized protein LOC112093412 n=1 Tax=Morus notabilis TaxID=981085 RepID=UPI000CED1427|nr:uncharacterized protein LOC112093412 [Morus notabilis]
MSNPIFALLASQILNGENFVKWKSNMNILLICENYHFIVKEDCPPVPPANAAWALAERYDRWINANNKARCYLLAAMNEVLRTQHEGLASAKEIMDTLQRMFGRPSDSARHAAVKAVMNDRMKNGSSVREHMLKMINHLNEAEINGSHIDEKTQVGMILETLSPDFLPFRTSYLMNQKNDSLTELLNELQQFESLTGDKGGKANVAEANAVEGRPSSSKNKKKKNQGNNKGKMEEEDPEEQAEQGCSKMLETSRDLEEGAFQMRVGNRARISATAVRTVRLLHEQFVSVSLDIEFVSLSKNGIHICSDFVDDGLYFVKTIFNEMLQTEMFKVTEPTPKRRKVSNENETYMWHLRLGHINIDRIEMLAKDGPLRELKVGTPKRPFSAKGERAKTPFEIINTDVCGPLNVKAMGGYEYFVTFIDDHSRFEYTYLMQKKSETFEKFKEFRVEVEKQLGKSIKTLRSDR